MAEAERVATEGGYSIAAKVVLFSGGQDSTAVAHMFHDTPGLVYAHANTGIGIEETRQFVRDTVAGWGRELIEEYPQAGREYHDLVLGKAFATPRPGSPRYDPAKDKQPEQQIWQGFPGPAGHSLMYRSLKENAMKRVRARLLEGKKKSRVIFITGIRQAESERRKSRPEVAREGNTVWASPILHYTKPDLNDYYRAHLGTDDPVPRNEITDLIHMSGECLCGAFAHQRELEELEDWAYRYPGIRAVVDQIHALEKAAAEQDPPIVRCKWGFAARVAGENPALATVGPMCTTCEDNADSEIDTSVTPT
jgi:3'-phosphoadenosine 5'-phosphosulfate sulfotransferase (PAPS reductase)/FAD synthetase